MRLGMIENIKLFGFFLAELRNQIKKNLRANKLGYYTHIDDIPIYNWDKIENGHFEFLYKNERSDVPEFFMHVINDMFFQFEKVNIDYIRKTHQLAYLRNLYMTTKKISFLNKANHLSAELKRQNERPVKKSTLNEKLNYIETVFDSIGNIDVKKMSASRFYSLYDLALKKAQKEIKNQKNGINK